MNCPECGHKKMETKITNEILSYKGKHIVLRNMKGSFCTNCGEGIWDTKSYKRYTDAQTLLLGAHIASAEIKRIRKKFKLTQIALAKAFGMGKITFSRYERGETSPPAPVMKLLRLLDQHPELLPEIQAETTLFANKTSLNKIPVIQTTT